MTQREMFNAMVKVVNEASVDTIEEVGFSKDELLEGINARIEALDKKNSSSSSKPTKKQLENEGIYNNIIEIMSDNASRTVRQITDIYNSTFDADLSTNRVQPQVTKAVKNGIFNRTVVKGVVYFVSK
jgi:hypothetical protein